MSRGRTKEPDRTDATVTFTYESAYNQIAQPLSYVSLSHYFISHWLPVISPNGLKILLRLRAMGFYNPKGAVQRGDIDIEQKDLAALCGMSLSTLKRAFADDPVLSNYVQRVFRTKRDPRTGRIEKEHYLYVVKMDDVLAAEDKLRLEDMIQGPDKPRQEPRGHYDLLDGAPRVHNDPSAVQNELPTVHFEPSMVQNELSLNRSLTTPNTLNTPNTPAGGPEISLTLFEENQDVLDRLPHDQWAALEAEARAQAITETTGPIRDLVKAGKAWAVVKPLMRNLLASGKRI